MFFVYLDTAVRSVVLVALIYAAAVALTHWAVRGRRIEPFGGWARFVRRASDPLLVPLERRILLLSLTQWLIGTAAGLVLLAHGGPRVWVRVLLSALFTILMTAILIRVIASWFGIGRYRRWMRAIYALTDWLIEPIRRVLPAVGPFDFSPMVAWLVLYVVRGFVLGMV